MKHTWLLLIPLLFLNGCVPRDQADIKLAKGCQAGAEAFLEEDFKIKEIKNKTFKTTSTDFGSNFREVKITALETDEWIEREEDYICLFAEELTAFGTKHNATIYQLKIYEKTYGMDGTTISGGAEAHMKLNTAVENAMKE